MPKRSEPGDDVARSGRVALVGEERGDRLRVGRLRPGGAGSGLRRSCADGTRQLDEQAMRSVRSARPGGAARVRAGPVRATVVAIPAARSASAAAGRSPTASQTAAGPSPWRASVAARRPSVVGSSEDERQTPAGQDVARPTRHRAPSAAESGASTNRSGREVERQRRARRPPGRARPSPSRAPPDGPRSPDGRVVGRRGEPGRSRSTRPAASPEQEVRAGVADPIEAEPLRTAGSPTGLSAKTPR